MWFIILIIVVIYALNTLSNINKNLTLIVKHLGIEEETKELVTDEEIEEELTNQNNDNDNKKND